MSRLSRLARILPDRSLLKPTIALFFVVFLHQFINIMYAGLQIAPPALISLLLSFAFLWVVCWWFEAEFTRTKAHWPMDTGMLLNAAWFVLLPVYLVKTRGLSSLLGIAGFIASAVAAWISATVIILLFL